MVVAPAVAPKRDCYLGMWSEALDLEVTARSLMARARQVGGMTKARGTAG